MCVCVRASRLLVKEADECQAKVWCVSPPLLPYAGSSTGVARHAAVAFAFDPENPPPLSALPHTPSQTHLRGAPLQPCFVFLPALVDSCNAVFCSPGLRADSSAVLLREKE